MEIESEQVPREYYDIIASLNDRLEESEVPQRYIDRALDKIESVLVQALDRAEEDADDTDGDLDSDGEDDDSEEARPG